MFHKLHEVRKELETREDFEDSEFFDAEQLLKLTEEYLLYAFSGIDDGVEELYFFLHDNSQIIQREGDYLLCELDEKRFVLLDTTEEYIIVINRGDEEEFIDMLN